MDYNQREAILYHIVEIRKILKKTNDEELDKFYDHVKKIQDKHTQLDLFQTINNHDYYIKTTVRDKYNQSQNTERVKS